jgi:hypothetical protein
MQEFGLGAVIRDSQKMTTAEGKQREFTYLSVSIAAVSTLTNKGSLLWHPYSVKL